MLQKSLGCNQSPRFPRFPAVKRDHQSGGKIIPVLDVRLQFGKEPSTITTVPVLSLLISAVSVGLIVDNVEEVLTIDDEEIAPLPKTGFENRFMKGIGKAGGKVQDTDCERLLKK